MNQETKGTIARCRFTSPLGRQLHHVPRCNVAQHQPPAPGAKAPERQQHRQVVHAPGATAAAHQHPSLPPQQENVKSLTGYGVCYVSHSVASIKQASESNEWIWISLITPTATMQSSPLTPLTDSLSLPTANMQHEWPAAIVFRHLWRQVVNHT